MNSLLYGQGGPKIIIAAAHWSTLNTIIGVLTHLSKYSASVAMANIYANNVITLYYYGYLLRGNVLETDNTDRDIGEIK